MYIGATERLFEMVWGGGMCVRVCTHVEGEWRKRRRVATAVRKIRLLADERTTSSSSMIEAEP